MNVWFAERGYSLNLEKRTDIERLGPKFIELPVEYLYIPGHGAFSAPYDVINAEWRAFSNDECLIGLFEQAISGGPTTLRNLRKFDLPDANVRDLLEIGRMEKSLDTMFKREISPVSLKTVVQDYF